MRGNIINFINANYPTNGNPDYIDQVKSAVYLVASSSQAACQK